MLVFGPYRSIPTDASFTVFNLSSPTQVIPRLPGLMVFPDQQQFQYNGQDSSEMNEKSFDMWYYNYVLNDPVAFSSLMGLLIALYEGTNVYICIADYSNGNISIINESFMKMIQARYDIKYSIINDREDYLYIPIDGCDFGSVAGIRNFDEDRKRYILLVEEERIKNGGTFVVGY